MGIKVKYLGSGTMTVHVDGKPYTFTVDKPVIELPDKTDAKELKNLESNGLKIESNLISKKKIKGGD